MRYRIILNEDYGIQETFTFTVQVKKIFGWKSLKTFVSTEEARNYIKEISK